MGRGSSATVSDIDLLPVAVETQGLLDERLSSLAGYPFLTLQEAKAEQERYLTEPSSMTFCPASHEVMSQADMLVESGRLLDRMAMERLSQRHTAMIAQFDQEWEETTSSYFAHFRSAADAVLADWRPLLERYNVDRVAALQALIGELHSSKGALIDAVVKTCPAPNRGRLRMELRSYYRRGLRRRKEARARLEMLAKLHQQLSDEKDRAEIRRLAELNLERVKELRALLSVYRETEGRERLQFTSSSTVMEWLAFEAAQTLDETPFPNEWVEKVPAFASKRGGLKTGMDSEQGSAGSWATATATLRLSPDSKLDPYPVLIHELTHMLVDAHPSLAMMEWGYLSRRYTDYRDQHPHELAVHIPEESKRRYVKSFASFQAGQVYKADPFLRDYPSFELLSCGLEALFGARLSADQPEKVREHNETMLAQLAADPGHLHFVLGCLLHL